MFNKETNTIRGAPIRECRPVRGVDFNVRITHFHPNAPIRGVPLYSSIIYCHDIILSICNHKS